MSGRAEDRAAAKEHKEHQEGWAVPIDRLDAFAAGAALAVDFGAIERELAALWRLSAERAQAAGGPAVIRACLWNCIVHVRGRGEFLRVKGVLDELSQVVPTRLIVLYERAQGSGDSGVWGDDGAPLRAFVEANSRTGPGGRREMISEEITLESSSIEAQRLPGLVRGLLLPDVPTAVFWTGAPVPAHLLRLGAEADRVIIDSGRAPDAAALQTLVQPLLDSTSRIELREVIDLGWLRLRPWRSLTASLFDHQEARLALDETGTVTVRHGPGGLPAALLMVGWLMARLDWRAAGRPGDGLRDPRGDRLTLDLAEVDGPPGLLSIGLRGPRGDFVARQGHGGICLQSPLSPGRVQPIGAHGDADLLGTALGGYGRDPLMLQALRAALPLVDALCAGAAGELGS